MVHEDSEAESNSDTGITRSELKAIAEGDRDNPPMLDALLDHY